MLSLQFQGKNIVKIGDRCFLRVFLFTVLIISFQNCSKAKFREVVESSSENEVFTAPVTESSAPVAPTELPQTDPAPKTPTSTPTAPLNKISCSGSYDLVVWTDNNNNGIINGNSPIATIKSLSVVDLDRPNLTTPGFNIYAAKFKSSASSTTTSQALGLQGNNIPDVSCIAVRNELKTLTILFSNNTGQDIVSGLLTNDTSYVWCKFASTSQNSKFNIYNEKQEKVATANANSVIITNNCGKYSQ